MKGRCETCGRPCSRVSKNCMAHRQGAGVISLDRRLARLEAKIRRQPEGGCWIWLGGQRKDGRYGLYRGRHAHRGVYELLVGPVPAGLELDHLCRNGLCVNPAHLEPVTHQVNVRRGIGPTAKNARKTACAQGHPYDKVERYGGRRCRECQRIYLREWKRSRRHAAS